MCHAALSLGFYKHHYCLSKQARHSTDPGDRIYVYICKYSAYYMEERGSRHDMRRKGEKVQGVCKGKEVENEATNDPEEERVHNQMKKREDSTLL